ncbi:hypothetical protein [Amorphus orientalis]|uniref:Uncharacterized protein n=1 Tax=Amorphus orientalis TaxID=649198 RepID=A0AAE3VSJ9_9HYPH|nr:hypothetical protein [Amorphus orientalis]MDQ0317422.1 hypothetical protein [Amorphus orientalis]
MTSGFRLDVPGDGAQASELRLGGYQPGDEGIPGNYPGDPTQTDGILMTTRGEFALVSAKPAFAQHGKTVDIEVASGGFDLDAADSFTLTAKSLYLQSAEGVDASSSPPVVADGQVNIQTTSDFELRSHTSDVRILCEEGEYSTVMNGGWLIVMGRTDESSGTETAIKLIETIEVPAVWNFNYDSYYCLIRGVHTMVLFNESEAAVFSSSAIGAEFGKAEIKSGMQAIVSKACVLTSRVGGLVNSIYGFQANNNGVEVENEEIVSDNSIVSNEMNAAPQIITE